MGSPTQNTDSVLSVSAADFVLNQLQIQPNPLTEEEAQELIRAVIKMVSPQINYLGEFRPLHEVLDEHAGLKKALIPDVNSASFPIGFTPRTKVVEVFRCWLDASVEHRTYRVLYLADEDLLSLDIIVSGAVHWQLMPLEVEQVFYHFRDAGTYVQGVRGPKLDFRGITFGICSFLLQTADTTVHRKTSQLESMTELRDGLAGVVERLRRVPTQPSPS